MQPNPNSYTIPMPTPLAADKVFSESTRQAGGQSQCCHGWSTPHDSGCRFARCFRVQLSQFLLVVICTLYGCGSDAAPIPEDPTALMKSIMEAVARKKWDEVDRLVQPLLEDEDEVLRQTAIMFGVRAALERHQPNKAVGYVEQLTESEQSDAADSARALVAIARFEKLNQIGKAAAELRTLVERHPDATEMHEALARILGGCSLRREAIEHVLAVIEVRDTDLLMLLTHKSRFIRNPAGLEAALEADSADPLPPFGIAALEFADGNLEEARVQLQEIVQTFPDFAPGWALLGRVLVDQGEFEALKNWAATVPEAANSEENYWVAMASWAEQSKQHDAVARCFAEVLKRDPESVEAMSQILKFAYDKLTPEVHERLQQRVADYQALTEARDRALRQDRRATMEELLAYIRLLHTVGRRREARAWSEVAAAVDVRACQESLTDLNFSIASTPRELTLPAQQPATWFEWSDWPLPKTPENPGAPTEDPQSALVLEPITFTDVANEVGFDFAYQNGRGEPPLVKMFEFTGGGIGVLDFDNNGLPDFFCSQGLKTFEPDSAPELGDRLFRNLATTTFADASQQAFIYEGGFGQGVAVGDLNSDGFPDVYVANIGHNQVWINQGDGTFEPLPMREPKVPTQTPTDLPIWTTSVLCADLNGDADLDIYDVHYLTAPDVYTRTCRHTDGSTAQCSPFDFSATPDTVWLSSGDGNFQDVSESALRDVEPAKGLGVMAWSPSPGSPPAVFVTNDTTPNQLLEPVGSPQWHLQDNALIAGVAFNRQGKAEGSMGIALGDVDADGDFDLHITNFASESNTVYRADGRGRFSDDTGTLGLREPTWAMLGFGTAFFDADCDARYELFVANGHVQDFSPFGKAFRMPPQLFRWGNDRFEEQQAESAGQFFTSEHLGRAVVVCDWNADLKPDLVVGQLDSPYALLNNTTQKTGNGLSLQLIGTRSNRDAIGAIVTATIGDQRVVRQITAGDGYQANSEKRLFFGIGANDSIDDLSIAWPSGRVDHVENVDANQRLTAVEPVTRGSKLVLHSQ